MRHSAIVSGAASLLVIALAGGCSGGGGSTCTDGATRCEGTLVASCTEGAWSTRQDCADSGLACVLAGGEVGATCGTPPPPVCAAGAQGCLVDALRECDGDGWVEIADCAVDGGTCVQLSDTAASCLATCRADDERCDPGANAVEACVGDAWLVTDRCTVSDQLCVPDTFDTARCRRDCADGETRCNAGAVERCDYIWVADHPCGADAVCVEGDEGAGCLPAECDDGEERCRGPLHEVCEGRRWAAGADCGETLGGDAICRLVDGGGHECRQRECADGDGRCVDGAPEACPAGLWERQAACGEEEVCVAAPTPACVSRECDQGQRSCGEGGVLGCNGGLWEVETPCGSAEVCADRGAGPSCHAIECESGDSRCRSGAVERCATGLFEPAEVCAPSRMCVDGDGGPRCVTPCEPGEQRCSGADLERCAESRLWEREQTCASSCVALSCTDGSCPTTAGCAERCTGDGECASGDCAPIYDACFPVDRKDVCETCSSDAECGLFADACVGIVADGREVERACGRLCNVAADCPRAYTCSTVGQCVPRDGLINWHTCAAVRDLLAGKSCVPALEQCGLPNVSDGTCYQGKCAIGCFDDEDCPRGTHCQETAFTDFCVLD